MQVNVAVIHFLYGLAVCVLIWYVSVHIKIATHVHRSHATDTAIGRHLCLSSYWATFSFGFLEYVVYSVLPFGEHISNGYGCFYLTFRRRVLNTVLPATSGSCATNTFSANGLSNFVGLPTTLNLGYEVIT